MGQALGQIRGGQELRLAYDGLGRRRLERRGKTGAVDTDVVLEYDGPNVIQETAAATGAIQFSTLHAPAIDAPMATWFGQLTPTTKTYDLGTNARGDVTVVAKAGSLSEEQLLDPYGEREAKVGTAATCVEGKETGTASLPMQTCTTLTILQRFGIGGARQHPSTKLVDLRNRVYATHLRGFLTKDPMGSIDSDGLYNYVAGDPLRDPWGLAATESEPVGDSPPRRTHNFDDGDDLDPDSIPAEGTGTEMVIERQRCDAECQQRRETGKVLREAEQSGVFDDDPPAPAVASSVSDQPMFENRRVQMRQRAAEMQTASPPRRVWLRLQNILDFFGMAIEYAVPDPFGPRGAGPLPGAKPVPPPPGCFVEGTSVLSPDGEVAIEDVKVGDFVLTRDAESNAWSWQQVTRTFVHRVPGVLALTMVDDEGNATTLMVTPEHPFMSVIGEFVEAGDLQPSDEVSTVAGTARIVESTWLPGDITVFNFEVDETHTYFVGDLGAWVHNKATRAAPWSVRGRLRQAALPGGGNASGPFRYRPPEGYQPGNPLPRGKSGGYLDRFGNEWVEGPYHGNPNLGFTFEWDVQLSQSGKNAWGQASPGATYLNVRPDGFLSH